MGHRLGLSQTGRVEYCCVGSDVHEHAVRGERTFAPIAQCDSKRERCDESAVAEDEFISGRVIPVQMNLDNTVHHFALARVYSTHVDGDRPCLDSELPLPSHK